MHSTESFMRLSIVLFFLTCMAYADSFAGDGLRIRVSIEGTTPGDTLQLTVYGSLIAGPAPVKEVVAVRKSPAGAAGEYEFSVPAFSAPAYISLDMQELVYGAASLVPVMEEYLAEPGDNIRLKVRRLNARPASRPELKYRSSYSYSFSGRGSAKYGLRYRLDHELDTIADMPLMGEHGVTSSNKTELALSMIALYEAQLSTTASQVLLADAVAETEMERLRPYAASGAINKSVLSAHDAALSKEAKLISRYYAAYLASVYSLLLRTDRQKPGHGAYFMLKSDLSGQPLLEKALLAYLLQQGRRLSADVFADALTVTTTPFFRQQASRMKELISPENLAYDFSLPDQNGKMISLSDFRGKVVFVDFWFTGCRACGSYYRTVLENAEEQMRDRPDVVFMSVSVDKDKNRWLSSVRSGAYTSQHAVNLFTEGKGSEHSIIEQFKVFSYPRPMLFDRKGRLFTSQDTELRLGGEEKLLDTIEQALKKAD